MAGTANSVNADVTGFQSYNASTGAWNGRTFQAGSGMTITNPTGTGGDPVFSVATSGMTWVDATSATQTLAVNSGYVTDRGGGVTYTLPATASLGDEIKIMGKLGAWSVAQNASQQILLGTASSSVGAGGSISSTDASDSINLVCITAGASTVWRAIGGWGNLSYV